MAWYSKVNGTQVEIKKLYTKVSGTQKEIKEAYTKVNGSLKQIHKSGIALSTLATGTEIVYNNKRYTLIAHNGFVSGDVVLWTKNGSTLKKGGVLNQETTQITPFGTANTNQVTIKYSRHSSEGNIYQASATGYGVILPSTTLGSTQTVVETPSAFSYLSTQANRIRYNASGTATMFFTSSVGTYQDSDDEYWNRYYYFDASGAHRNDRNGSVNALADIFAYSVKGTLMVGEKNSDGSYTLQI